MSTDPSDTVPNAARPLPGSTGDAPPSTAPVASDDHVPDADASPSPLRTSTSRPGRTITDRPLTRRRASCRTSEQTCSAAPSCLLREGLHGAAA